MSFRAVASWLFASIALVPALSAAPVDLSLPDLDGNQQTLEQYRGQVVVLNFWATWCVPCREEMPLLTKVQERYASQDLVVVGASADDASTQAQIAPFVQELGIKFPVWMGATIADMERLELGAALPATAILDRDGEIAFRIIGILKRKDLTRRVEYLLSEKRGKAPEPLIDTLSEAIHDHEGHDHSEEEEHTHGGVGIEGASLVPS